MTGQRQTYAEPETTAATRTATPLIQVPQSVQVLTRSLIQEQDRRTLGDALVNVSGVTPTRPDEVLFIPPIIRGFPADVYLDGLSVFAGNQQAYDPNSLVGIERIDVLKGPTATLYGGGIGTPLGGVVNLESVRPNDKAGGYLAMRAGSFSTWNPYGDINVPLADGIAARLTGEYQSSDRWIDKVHGERWSGNPASRSRSILRPISRSRGSSAIAAMSSIPACLPMPRWPVRSCAPYPASALLNNCRGLAGHNTSDVYNWLNQLVAKGRGSVAAL